MPGAISFLRVRGAVKGVGGADEGGQVGAFDVVELKGYGEAAEDLLGDAADISAFEAGVVLDADRGELGNL